MSVPAIFIPDTTGLISGGKVIPRNSGFPSLEGRDTDDIYSTPPHFQEEENEELVAQNIKSFIKNECGDLKPSMLFDCRSSSSTSKLATTYQLTLKTGLNAYPPVLLEGQAGSEVLMAIIFIKQMNYVLENGVIISAFQRIDTLDNNTVGSMFAYADAASAIGIAPSPIAFGKSFKVIGAAIAQQSGGSYKDLKIVVDKLLADCEISKTEKLWSVGHMINGDLSNRLSEILPDANWITRDLYPTYNFGCVDPLISLYDIFINKPSPPRGKGLVWFAGRFGSLGIAVFNSESVGMWHEYTHYVPSYVGK